MSYSCDERGYINFIEGLVINQRYKLVAQIGKGTFSRVIKCVDKKISQKHQTKHYVAIKINRNVDKYQVAAKVEYEILQAIKNYDKDNVSFCAHLTSSFDYYGHRCFVFPLYGRSVYGFLSSNKYTPFASVHVKQFAWQIIQAVKFLHKIKIIFTDLKPENIVFVTDRSIRRTIAQLDNSLPSAFQFWKMRMKNAGYTDDDIRCLTVEIPIDVRIKVIDFGSALFEARWHNHLVQTRHYRAPEVVLGMRWSFPIDIWSIGCIMLEFIYGRMVFNTHDSIDHLSQMTKMIGPMPDKIRNKIPNEVREAYFKRDGSLKLQNAKISSVQCHPLKRYFESYPSPSDSKRAKDPKKPIIKQEDMVMMDLVDKMLRWDPDERISAAEALQHPYFKGLDTTALYGPGKANRRSAPRQQRAEASDYPSSAAKAVAKKPAYTPQTIPAKNKSSHMSAAMGPSHMGGRGAVAIKMHQGKDEQKGR